MADAPSRRDLDALAAHHRLGPAAVEALLDLARARPTAGEERRLLVRGLGLAGVLSLCAGVIFFVAANWEALGHLGRFALVEALLAAAAGAALWRPPPDRVGRLGLLAAFVLAGALLALFGQTYQTGADLWELFLAWAGLGLPLVLLAGWSVAWGAWALVVNTALALLCGWVPGQHVLWTFLLGAGLTGPALFTLAVAANLALYAASEAAAGTRLAAASAPWLGRLLVAAATVFGCWGASMLLFDLWHGDPRGRGGPLLVAVLVAAAASLAGHALRRRDVYPLTALAGAAVYLGAAAILRAFVKGRFGTPLFFWITLWLVASSTVAGRLLMGRVRAWRGEGR